MAPIPPNVRSVPAKPCRSSRLRQPLGGPGMAPIPPNVRSVPAKPCRSSRLRQPLGGPGMAPIPPNVRSAPGNPWRSSGSVKVPMARDFRLPDLGEGLTEAEIVKVLVREGEVIAEDAPLLEVETDKATVEIPSPMSGRVEKIHVEPNQTVKVGQVLVTFADAGAQAAKGTPSGKQAADTLDPTRTLAPEPRTTVQDGRARQAAPPEPSRAPARPGPVPATPATRRLARELGVDLQAVRATGPGGRVTDDDARSASGRVVRAPTTAAPRTARAEPTAPAAPGKPLPP